MTLKNSYNKNIIPSRVVILGSNGFISSAVIKKLAQLKINTLNISRSTHNLEDVNSTNQLSNLINLEDTILFVAANAPVKDNEMLKSNMLICENICNLLKKKSLNHLIYISSDAVYKDSMKPLNEKSCAEPDSLHGLMHLSREILLKNIFTGPMCIFRPTLIYGKNDPHNGYGPNKFYRNVINNQNIDIFGKGEENRDHIYIDDIAEIILLSILRKSFGTLNLASGKVLSFNNVAENIIRLTNSKSIINYLPRVGVMPHNGYRAFDVSQINKSFPEISLTKFIDGINEIINNNKS